jgi:hypothetical protein
VRRERRVDAVMRLPVVIAVEGDGDDDRPIDEEVMGG